MDRITIVGNTNLKYINNINFEHYKKKNITLRLIRTKKIENCT